MHFSELKNISACVRCDSGLWHQAQESGQPLKNTAVRMPGPSCTQKRCILKIIPFIVQASCAVRKSTSACISGDSFTK